MMVEIGDIITVVPAFLKDVERANVRYKREYSSKERGVVSYINREHRWYLLEFEAGYKEAFKF